MLTRAPSRTSEHAARSSTACGTAYVFLLRGPQTRCAKLFFALTRARRPQQAACVVDTVSLGGFGAGFCSVVQGKRTTMQQCATMASCNWLGYVWLLSRSRTRARAHIPARAQSQVRLPEPRLVLRLHEQDGVQGQQGRMPVAGGQMPTRLWVTFFVNFLVRVGGHGRVRTMYGIINRSYAVIFSCTTRPV